MLSKKEELPEMSSDKLTGLKRIMRTFSLIRKESIRHQRSAIAIMIEMLHLFIKNTIGPNYYLQAGMADPLMSWDYKKSHISDKDYHRALDKLNPRPYRKITQHKLAEKSFLQFAKIPCSEFIGFLAPIKGFDYQGGALNNDSQVILLLTQFVNTTVCIKIPEGVGGDGFYSGKVLLDNGILKMKALNEDDTLTVSQVLDRYRQVIAREGLLFEAFVEQHPTFAKFNPSSVNTLRIWVLETNQTVAVIGTYIRIGRQGQLTDNAGSGGIMCPVNLKTGVLGRGLTTAVPFRDNFEQHPDHQAQMYGVQLPCWKEIIHCAEETLKKLPHTRFVGLDLAMTTKGPIIIEVNVSPDKNGAANGMIRSDIIKKTAQECALLN